MLRHCDDDLIKLLQESAPPADTDRVDCFRAAGARYMKKAGAEILVKKSQKQLFVLSG